MTPAQSFVARLGQFKKFFRQHQIKREGLDQDSEWAVIDLGLVMVHLMSPGAREQYALEEGWRRSHAETTDPAALAAQMKPRWLSQDPSKLALLEDEADTEGPEKDKKD